MSADNAIMVQVAGKIAAELAASINPRNAQDATEAFDKCFDHVLQSLRVAVGSSEVRRTKGGRQVPVISQDEIKIRLNQTLQSGSAVTTNLVQF